MPPARPIIEKKAAMEKLARARNIMPTGSMSILIMGSG
jgi:hypothetical protein